MASDHFVLHLMSVEDLAAYMLQCQVENCVSDHGNYEEKTAKNLV